MNYRHIITELYIDLKERRDNEKKDESKKIYTQIMTDLWSVLDNEVQEIKVMNEVFNILKEKP